MNLISTLFESPSCKFKVLQSEGFYTPNYYEFHDYRDVLTLYKQYMKTTRDSLNYDIDGLVQEVNDFDLQKELGFKPNGLIPNFATAIKFDSMGGITPLISIRWTVGMTGKIIPTGIFKPVDILGSTISKATFHNYEFLENLIKKEGLKIGSDCIIIKSGDVIPKMMGVKTSGNGEEINIIENCPECGTKLHRFSVELVCENMACTAKIKGIFTNMFDTLDIKGISDKFVDKVIETYGITTINELMNLTITDFEKLPGFAKKSAKNAYDAIHSITEVSPQQYFALLNIPNQGVRVFENLFAQFPMSKLLDKNFKPEDILDTKGIAEKSANAIHQGIQDNLERLRENSIWFTIKENDITSDKTSNYVVGIKDNIFCITGTLNLGKRKDYETMIIDRGGKIGSVTKTLNYLVTNDEDTTSSKMKKTLSINEKIFGNEVGKGIIIITEEKLRELMEIK